MAAEKSNHMSKEWWLRGRRRAERSYSTFNKGPKTPNLSTIDLIQLDTSLLTADITSSVLKAII